MNEVRDILTAVRDGKMDVESALQELKLQPFQDLGYAKIDTHRKVRQGTAEVIYGAGKTPEQMLGICRNMMENGQKTILITRLSPESGAFLQEHLPLTYHKEGSIGIVGPLPPASGLGKIFVDTGF